MRNRAKSPSPRRTTSPEKQVQLPLRAGKAKSTALDDGERPSGPFWKWVGIIALLHLVLLVSVGIFYAAKPKPPVQEPEKQFFSLLPKGSAVHGSPGESQSPTPKPVEPTPVAAAPEPPPAQPDPPEIAPPKPTPQPVAVQPKPPVEPPPPVKPPTPPKPKVVHTPAKPKPKPEPPKPVKPVKPIVKEVKPTPPVVKPPPPEPPPVKPVVKEIAPPVPNELTPPPDPEPPKPMVKEEPVKPVAKEEPVKPVAKEEPSKPAPKKPKAEPTPEKPKVRLAKNDLQLTDAPESETTDKPAAAKPSLAKKDKPKAAPSESTSAEHDKPAAPEKPGPTAAEIAAKFGAKLQAAGVKDSVKVGTSGSIQTPKENPYAGFYASVRDQVMNKWEHPNLSDETAINPVVTIHVEKDGRVPAEGVFLSRSSGNKSYDDSAVAAAKRLGFTLQPLPEGCPPDIHITFKLTR